MNERGRPSGSGSGARSASAQPTSCCSAARQTASRGDGAGNSSFPHARASWPEIHAWAGWETSSPSARTSTRRTLRGGTAARRGGLSWIVMSRAQRLTFLGIAAVIAIVAVVILVSTGDDDDDETEATGAQATATATPTPPAAESEGAE